MDSIKGRSTWGWGLHFETCSLEMKWKTRRTQENWSCVHICWSWNGHGHWKTSDRKPADLWKMRVISSSQQSCRENRSRYSCPNITIVSVISFCQGKCVEHLEFLNWEKICRLSISDFTFHMLPHNWNSFDHGFSFLCMIKHKILHLVA